MLSVSSLAQGAGGGRTRLGAATPRRYNQADAERRRAFPLATKSTSASSPLRRPSPRLLLLPSTSPRFSSFPPPRAEAKKGGSEVVSQKEQVSVPAAAPAKSSSSTSPPAEERQQQQQQQQQQQPAVVDVFARDASLWPAARPSLDVAIDKAKDTLADLAVIARRTFSPATPRVSASPPPSPPGKSGSRSSSSLTRLRAEKPVLLVLGSGWGSHALSKIVDTELFDVVIVSPTNHFCFTPMLPSAAVGTVGESWRKRKGERARERERGREREKKKGGESARKKRRKRKGGESARTTKRERARERKRGRESEFFFSPPELFFFLRACSSDLEKKKNKN